MASTHPLDKCQGKVKEIDMGSGPVITSASENTQLAGFVAFCEQRADERFEGPQAFQAFSVARYREFWQLFLDWADPLRCGEPEPVCSDERCEHARFFPNLELSYAENLLEARSPEQDQEVALVSRHGDGSREEITRRELRQRVRSVAAHLRALGVEAGDRVVAIAANDSAAAIAALATATLGATFSSAAPEMGAPAILSRFEQLSPKLLMATFAAEGAAEVASSLPTVQAMVALDELPVPGQVSLPVHRISELAATPPAQPLPEGWQRFPFNHPLFVLFTSGTTGPPKCIVHGAGGTLLEHLKEHRLHCDLGPGDVLFFQTSAAWMMWNWQLSALACGTRVVVYDGPLAGAGTLWRIASEEKATVFGTSPPYLQLCEDSGFSPAREAPTPALRAVLSTGSVLRDWQFDWVEREVGPVKLQSISGGTDIIGCFVLGHPELPVRRGMIQCRSLGMDVQALPAETTPSDSPIGELICRNPFPSRPLGFLGDEDGSRFHSAYFAENEGVWTHGDLIEFDPDGQARIHGRSDGVLNIQGIRIGPSEIYQALREVPEVQEAMAVEQRRDSAPRLLLLVVMKEGARLDPQLTLRIRKTIGSRTTPLHAPELIVAVPALPVTHSGKRSEKAGRAAVEGADAGNRRALANPEALEEIRAAVAAAEAAQAERERAGVPVDAPTVEKLRFIWEAVLGLEGIGEDEDFFGLGGTSLQALEVFARMREHLAVDLPLSALIEAPTLAGLAAVVEDPSRLSAPLVQIRPGSVEPPLYFIHSLWGDVIEMRQVAMALKADVPVYGVRARGLNPGEEPQRSVEEMAETYVKVIRDHQPEGPYRLAGYSFGGLLAYETARRLTEEGERVEWLGLIDAELSNGALPPLRRVGRMIALPFHILRKTLNDPRAVVRALAGAVPAALRRGTSSAQRNPAIADQPPAWMEGASPTDQRLAGVFLDAGAAYRPRPYRGSLTYFVPEVRRFHLFPDPLPAWRRLVGGRVEVERVPGAHTELVSGPSGQVVARGIDRHFGG
jgi:acetoacetyl-CoA synthetase